MNTFGKIKNNILKKLTESYINENKKEVKNILNLIKENVDFRDLYLLYEDVEQKYISDKETAKFYVEELSNSLKGRFSKIKKTCQKLDESVSDTESINNPLYDMLDSLIEEDNLFNIENKVKSKIELVNYLTNNKNNIKELSETVISNEKLLHAILANNFNIVYNQSLSEDEKKEFKEIVSYSDEELKTKTNELKESILNQVSNILNETKDNELIQKLDKVKSEVNFMDTSKYNYYKLKELKNGLN